MLHSYAPQSGQEIAPSPSLGQQTGPTQLETLCADNALGFQDTAGNGAIASQAGLSTHTGEDDILAAWEEEEDEDEESLATLFPDLLGRVQFVDSRISDLAGRLRPLLQTLPGAAAVTDLVGAETDRDRAVDTAGVVDGLLQQGASEDEVVGALATLEEALERSEVYVDLLHADLGLHEALAAGRAAVLIGQVTPLLVAMRSAEPVARDAAFGLDACEQHLAELDAALVELVDFTAREAVHSMLGEIKGLIGAGAGGVAGRLADVLAGAVVDEATSPAEAADGPTANVVPELSRAAASYTSKAAKLDEMVGIVGLGFEWGGLVSKVDSVLSQVNKMGELGAIQDRVLASLRAIQQEAGTRISSEAAATLGSLEVSFSDLATLYAELGAECLFQEESVDTFVQAISVERRRLGA